MDGTYVKTCMNRKYAFCGCVICLVFLAFKFEGDTFQNILPETFNQYNFIKRISRYPVHFDPQNIPEKQTPSRNLKADIRQLIDKGVSADNHELIEIIRKYYIDRPSTKPYNLDVPSRLEYSNGQTPFIDSRLNYIENGFYVECGALTGEKGSNSFFFEKVRKWNGLLIEADPTNYEVLKKKQRKAFSANACLSPKPYPVLLKFHKGFNRGRLLHTDVAKQWIKQQRMKVDPIEVECFPLYSFMLALNRTTIDYFSLDVEGDELNVLMTIPFDRLNIKMLSVEYVHTEGGMARLKNFMQSKGYDTLLKVNAVNDWGVNDLIFRKKGLKH